MTSDKIEEFKNTTTRSGDESGITRFINSSPELKDIILSATTKSTIINTDEFITELMKYFSNNDSTELFKYIDVDGDPVIKRLIIKYIPIIKRTLIISPREYSYHHYVIALSIMRATMKQSLPAHVAEFLNVLNAMNKKDSLDVRKELIFDTEAFLARLVTSDINSLMMVLLLDYPYMNDRISTKEELYKSYRCYRVIEVLEFKTDVMAKLILEEGTVRDIILLINRYI